MFKFFKERLSKIKQALLKTRVAVAGRISSLFRGNWNEETLEELEQILYEADLGSTLAIELVDKTRFFLKKHKEATPQEILSFLHSTTLEILETPPKVTPKTPKNGEPRIILVVGVNGSGKTTSIAKIANVLQQEGKTVMIAAGDTFRAAAIDQIAAWAKRLNIPIIKSSLGSDPAAVAFDAVSSAKARGVDVLLIDTAGRLQNKTDLMRQLEKMVRAIRKIDPEAPHETLLVVDATTGQNAIDQAEVFHSFTPITGFVLTKLDGSAKGGIALSIYYQLGIPVNYVGVGEEADALLPFDKIAYLDALFDGK